MEAIEQLHARLSARFPDAAPTVVLNPGPAAQHSLLVPATQARAIAEFLRDDPELQLDTCSNVTGIDWPEREVTETVRRTVTEPPAADAPPGTAPAAKVVEEKVRRVVPGHLEVVYHLYSVARGHGPVILRLRTGDRGEKVALPSLTPVWRACEFQEREVFDLFGVVFTGHPDLRRLLMWDEFRNHPMRKDYVEPDDYEWEPTPHDRILAQARRHYPVPPTGSGEPAPR
ncbi:MAG: NADH-quinone oxidoreductase subunit C [Verrucomicrobia bacterium]|nr:NADH-quinone oxidoreductase subunit C [Verrucomicrobiota bacterium]